MPVVTEIPASSVECSLDLENLRCTICNGYLKCSPVRVVADGGSVCGRCPATDDEQMFRNATLETILSKISFPCEYQGYGCKKRLSFDDSNEHETNCGYRQVVCPSSFEGSCLWEGSCRDLIEHFLKDHHESVVDDFEINLLLNQDLQKLVMTIKDRVTFVLRWKYSAADRELCYNMGYYSCGVLEALYKLRLINSKDADCCISLKSNNCVPYTTFDVCWSGKLLIDNYVQNLNNPDSISVMLDLTITKSQDLIVDYNLLQALRCQKCQGYLVPPIYDYEKIVICTTCRKKYNKAVPSTDEELKQRVAQANLPCRWNGCNFVAKSDEYLKHEKACYFRIFKCIGDSNCKGTFRREAAAEHLEVHGYEFFSDVFFYKVVFNKEVGFRRLFCFKNDEIISIKPQFYFDAVKALYKHTLYLNVSSVDITDHSLQVYLEHNHCKMKSKTYYLGFRSHLWFFCLSLLPDCFNLDEELTLTLRI